ncbi:MULTISPECIES: lysylphosphatidylglycerol synthase transmembrane domain-containing protein [Bifidobacterium]|uniref:lysylphosphatidylglycerol synthase transmembrane domain-containing protein n=1 Tax=Bifidobacterium TaxID=1678 RepID=UPI001BDC679E|nr:MULTISPECIES: lysylphosphatidylglycerol synthase transmembrane domain-containing protein [Bifidobacterium]MBT1161055.1 flippase-like domain-containing protein [Bifidobacterium sp. SO1]MBW3078131.1 flippase-like domain-containing protein [Bifidobacterium simiiventris]
MSDQQHATDSADERTASSAESRFTNITPKMTDEGTAPVTTTVIDDVPPRRIHDVGDLLRAGASVVLAVVAMLSAMYLRGITTGVETDAHTAGQALNWMVDLPTTLLQQLAIVSIVVMVVAQLLLSRAWMQAALSVLAMFAALGAVWGISLTVTRFGDATLIAALSSPNSWTGSSLLPDFYAGAAALLTAGGPRRTRSTVKWGWNILYTVAALLVLLSVNSVAGVLVSFAIGRLIGMLLRFAVGTKNQGVWGEELVQALAGIDLHLVYLSRHIDSDESVSAAASRSSLDDDLVERSRRYDAQDDRGRHFVISVLDSQSHTAGYMRQLWQWIRFTGVSTRRDRSPREATQHHMAMLLGLHNCGLPTPRVYGVADTGESSILVLQGNDAMHECNRNTISDEDAIALMRFLSVANRRGYTHRRITPNTLARLESGTPIIAGWQNGDDASTAANVALDQVQLLALLAALIGPERAVAAGRSVWGVDTIIELIPFVQKAAIPKATRALDGWNNHVLDDLRARLRDLVPQDAAETTEPVTLSRFSVRSFIGLALLVVAVSVMFTQLKPDEVISAVRNANPAMAVICLAFGLVAWLGSALELGAFVDRQRRDPVGIFMSQVAQSFAMVSMPAGVGPAFVNLQFLRKSGYRNTAATAIMGAVLVVYYVGTVLLTLVVGLFTGSDALSSMIPTNTLIVVLGVVLMTLAVAMMIPPVRHFAARTILPLVKTYARQLVDTLSDPVKLLPSIAGMLVLNVATGLGFWVALLAFGYMTNPIETFFIFMIANAVGSSVPTPGGLGGVEAALTVSFGAMGVPAGVALSATLLYRVVFFWVRIPLGAAAMRWLDRRNLI